MLTIYNILIIFLLIKHLTLKNNICLSFKNDTSELLNLTHNYNITYNNIDTDILNLINITYSKEELELREKELSKEILEYNLQIENNKKLIASETDNYNSYKNIIMSTISHKITIFLYSKLKKIIYNKYFIINKNEDNGVINNIKSKVLENILFDINVLNNIFTAFNITNKKELITSIYSDTIKKIDIYILKMQYKKESNKDFYDEVNNYLTNACNKNTKKEELLCKKKIYKNLIKFTKNKIKKSKNNKKLNKEIKNIFSNKYKEINRINNIITEYNNTLNATITEASETIKRHNETIN